VLFLVVHAPAGPEAVGERVEDVQEASLQRSVVHRLDDDHVAAGDAQGFAQDGVRVLAVVQDEVEHHHVEGVRVKREVDSVVAPVRKRRPVHVDDVGEHDLAPGVLLKCLADVPFSRPKVEDAERGFVA